MLAEVLHKVAEMEEEESLPYYPRPSLSGPERCIRQLDYYAQNYDRKPFPGRFITVLDDSSWHEQLIKDWIRKSAFSIHSEQMEVNCGEVSGFPLKGHIDGIITDMLGIDRLIEIKAVSHFGFQDIWNGHLPLDYLTQSFLYFRGVKEINPEIMEALLFVKNKNQSQYLEFLLKYDPQSDVGCVVNMILSTGERKELTFLMENVTTGAVKKFEDVESFRFNNKVHDRPYERDHWRCQYCPYGELCWQGWQDEFESRAVDVDLGDEVGEMCRYYLETTLHISNMESERDELKGKIKAVLKEKNARKGSAGEYIVGNALRKRKGVDNKLIPPAILKQAEKETVYEVLTIVRRKENGK